MNYRLSNMLMKLIMLSLLILFSHCANEKRVLNRIFWLRYQLLQKRKKRHSDSLSFFFLSQFRGRRRRI